MSGTSADAVDVAVVDWPDDASTRPFELLAFEEFAHAEALQSEIHRLAAAELPAPEILPELVRLDRAIADVCADATLALLESAKIPLESIDGVASHGQTVAHHPEHGGSLQIGCPARIAERLGRPVIADFRRRDLAMGGEGAPLAPFFHWAVMSDPAQMRGVLNLGGIANLTWLPPGGRRGDVIAFDVGPANALLDAVVSIATEGRERFDRDGHRAAKGRVCSAWLDELLADPYLDRSPPKSTGRELYGLEQARQAARRAEAENVSTEDLLATLVEFSCRAIERAWRELEAKLETPEGTPQRLIVGGGGARNPVLMRRLGELLPHVRVETMDALGIPPDAAEAMAFSLLGRNRLLGIPNQLPQCTGVREARSLGVIHSA